MKNSFLIKAVSLSVAAALLLTGCSGSEEIESVDAPATVDTGESDKPEAADEQVTTTTAKTTAATTTTTTTTTTTAATTEATTTTAATTTTTTAATTTTTAATTTTTTAATTTTTTAATTTTTTAATTTTTAATTTTTTAPSTPSGTISGVDVGKVYQTLISFKSKYPEGTSWTNENRSYKSYTICPEYTYFEGKGCSAFALELSDTAFGSLPRREHYDVSAIRVGDIIRLDGNHSVIVLEVKSNSVIIAEGNYNSSVHWGRELTFSEIKSSLTYIWTRYP